MHKNITNEETTSYFMTFYPLSKIKNDKSLLVSFVFCAKKMEEVGRFNV